MAKGYTTEAKIEQYTLTDIAGSFAAQITLWIEAIENEIDLITGRNFIADASATARVFDGDGEYNILIDDCVEIETVELGNDDYGGTFTTLSASGVNRYFTEPMNAAAKGQPITSLVLQHVPWTTGKQNHRITAKWGYSAEVPKDIEFAATVLVAGIINAQRKDTQEIKSEKIGNYAVTYATEQQVNDFDRAMAILKRYTKINI